MSVYDINGNEIGNYVDPSSIDVKEKNLDYDATVKSVNHRGYSTEAPENTLPAYILSKQKGFNYVETDVSFTSDGVAMLLHDATIDRTSNGSGTLANMTYAQVRQYDFGSWKNAKYAGTKIPTLDEFLALCKAIMLHPYIELKSNGGYTQALIKGVVDAVHAHGLKGKVTYISFSSEYLGYVKNYDDEARLGFLSSPKTSDLTICQGLKTTKNSVFYDVSYYNNAITQEICDAYTAADIPIEAWTVDSSSDMLGLNKYVSGITSNNLIAGKVLYDNAMGVT
jgi:glycerophosphoryl diester phosphodiesterase